MNLLDVNVLLAIAWPNHQFHHTAKEWFLNIKLLWASCVITESGFIRLSSNPAFTREYVSPYIAAGFLEELKKRDHIFLSVSKMPGLDFWEKTLSHKIVTDRLLLHAAIENRATLITFDKALFQQDRNNVFLLESDS